MNFEAIKPGDKVWIEFKRLGVQLKRHAEIGRITKTQIFLAREPTSRYYRQNGYEIGNSYSHIVGIATDKEIATFARQQAKAAVREARLDKEEAALRKRFGPRGFFGGRGFDFSRLDNTYNLSLFGLTAQQIQAIADVLPRKVRGS
jgi:hypothetical protein